MWAFNIFAYLFQLYLLLLFSCTTFALEEETETTTEPQSVEFEPLIHETGVTCTTRKGSPGKCLPFSSCFPFIYRGETEFGNGNSGLAEEILDSTQDYNCTLLYRLRSPPEDIICCALERKIETDFTSITNSAVTFNNLRSQSCGETRTVERALGSLKITGGREARKGEFPWMVAIFGPNGKHTCGGSLLSPDYVLTAAHCLSTYNSKDISKLTVTIGDHNIKSTRDGAHELRNISKVLIHSGFNIKTHFNDIALMKLNRPVQFSNSIQPICLPSEKLEQLEGKNTVVIGWGRDRSHGSPADTLRKVEIPVWKLAECKRIYGIFAPGRVTDSNICAGDGKKSKDACIGDSGGPLSASVGGRSYVVGIVSWGKGCGSFPGVYARVESFLPWLEKNMK